MLHTLQNLAAEKTYNNLNVTLKEANEHRNEWFEGVHTCQKTDSLFAVMEIIVKAEVSQSPSLSRNIAMFVSSIRLIFWPLLRK